jgi:hypothetical protein
MNDTDFTDRETALIGLLTVHFQDRALNARLVDVNKLEGGRASTLRLTLDDTASTDIERDRIADASRPVEALADEAKAGLERAGRAV